MTSTSQTTVQEDDAVLFGSAKIELGLYSAGTGGLVNMGAANGVAFSFAPKTEIISFDNTEEWKRYANAEKATITGTFFELSGANIARLLAGVAAASDNTGNPTSVTNEQVTLTGTGTKRFAHKNGAGTEVATITVTSTSGGGTTYTRAAVGSSSSDYAIGIDAEGYTTITRTADSDITTGATVFCNYSYTPNASKQIDVGGITEQTYLIARLTNVRPTDSKKYEITCHKVALGGDMKWAFGADGDLKPNGMPFTLECIKDTTLANKYQLFTIIDEQSVV